MDQNDCRGSAFSHDDLLSSENANDERIRILRPPDARWQRIADAVRIVFLVNRDIESNFALNLLMPEIHRSAVGIFLSEQVGASRTVSARMFGQLAFIEQELFNDLVFPLVDQTYHGDGSFVSFGELQRRFGIPVQTLATLKDPSALQKLREMRAGQAHV